MIEYCEYNLYSLTGRPSNHFNQVNYAALNKSDESRRRFISRFGKGGCLLEVDLSGFHLYLLYLICELEFPKDVYSALSKYYPSDVNPKDFTFKQIYGGINKDLIDIEPFASIDALSRSMQEKYGLGTLKSLLFDRPIPAGIIEGSNPNKIFNYMLQNLETEFNSILIGDLLQGLEKLETKLVLYTYDSFLFDVNLEEKDSIVTLIKTTFKGIPYKVKAGRNYKAMKTV